MIETSWVAEHLTDPDLRLVEADENVFFYEVGHLPGAVNADEALRAFRDDVFSGLKVPNRRLIDVRSPEEYTGELVHIANFPQEGVQRGGHIPTAKSIYWSTTANADGTFKSADELRQIYGGQDINPENDVITYCRIGERSAHTWFVLTHLLGYPRVRNYDGSWTEWGNLVRAPIEKSYPGLGRPLVSDYAD